MVPMIRNILGGFLFSGDDIYKRAGVLSGGERTRLAVARMLLRPANTLLLDEPTNHLDLDSKDVLLEALEDFGGTLIFVSHDRYFVDRLATKIIAVGHGSDRGLPRHLRAVPLEPASAPAARTPPRRPQTRSAGRQATRQARGHTGSRTHATAAQNAPASADSLRAAPARRSRARPIEDKKRADADARQRRRAARRREQADRRPRSAGLPSGNRRSRTSKPRWRPPGFYDDRATLPMPLSRAIRRSCGRSATS